jgi:site-specific DNA-methyltransferase (adenine-specific)
MKNWKNFFPKKNRFFETENGILYNGDCLEVLNTFDDESIDLMITSPPYNVGIDYDSWDDKMKLDEYIFFIKKTLSTLKKKLKKCGRFAINIPYEVKIKHDNNKRISLLCEYYQIIKDVGLNYNTIIDLEEKHPQRVKYTAWGSYLSASAPYIYNPKECVLIGYNEVWKKTYKGESDIEKEEFVNLVSGKIYYRPETRKLTKANFSLDIPNNIIKGLSYKNDLILDIFMGSGTTALSAEKLGRRWIGIEISENYCNFIKNRLSNIQKEIDFV